MTIPARLRKASDLVVYTKLTVLTALFIKEFKKCIINSEYKDTINEVFNKFTSTYLKAAFALNEADKIILKKEDENFTNSYKKRLGLQKEAKTEINNLQIIINFIATLDYNNFTSIYHFSDKFDKIETMLNNWIKSDKKRFL